MALIFYDFALAPSPRRARIFLAEKGVAYENVQLIWEQRNNCQTLSAK